MYYIKKIIRDNYKMWLYLVASLAVITILSIILFCFIAGAKKAGSQGSEENRDISVEYYGVDDDILSNYLNSILIPLDIICHDNDFDIHLLGYCSDGYSVNIYYDLVMNEEIGSYYTPADVDYWDVSASVSAGGKSLFNYGRYIGCDGNTYHFYISVCSDENLTDCKIEFSVNSVRLVRQTKENIRYDTGFKYSFVNENVYIAEEIPVNQNVNLGYYGQGYLTGISVTPFGMIFNWKNHKEKNNRKSYSDFCEIKASDGKCLGILYHGCNYICWDIPQRTSNVVSITMGEYSLDILQNE